jgi:hypothetical protein
LNPRHFGCFTFIVCFIGESCLPASWCVGGRCSKASSDEDHGKSRRPGAEDRGWLHMSGTQWPVDQEVGWRCVRSALCTWIREAWVSWLSLKIRVDGLSMVWPQNHWDGFLWFTLKTGDDGFSRFGLKTGGFGFPSLCLKTGSSGLVI